MESFDDPVPSGNGAMQPLRDDARFLLENVGYLYGFELDILNQKFVQLCLQVGIEGFKFVFEEQLHQGACTLHPLVAIVISVIQLRRVTEAIQQLVHHEGQVVSLRKQILIAHFHMC